MNLAEPGAIKIASGFFLFEPAFEIFIAPMCHAPCKVAHHHEDRRFVFWIAVELFVRSVFEQIALTDVTGNLVPLYLEAGKRANNILVGDPVKRIAFVRIRNSGVNVELAKLRSVNSEKSVSRVRPCSRTSSSDYGLLSILSFLALQCPLI